MLFNFFNREPKPYNTGYLPEHEGHSIFFQQFGNPYGQPVLAFHGGPGSQGKPRHAGLFNLKKNRVILFDQRGCGKSLPRGEIRNNNTSSLISDAKRLLDHLQIRKAVIYGGSWGATLALLFCEQNRSYVEKIIITQTFLARQEDIEAISDDSMKLYPDIRELLKHDKPADKTIREYYADLALSSNAMDQVKSTGLYGNYEHMIGTLEPKFPDLPPEQDHIDSYRIYMHYDKHDYWVGNRILDDIHLIRDIPILIVHNRLDLVCPVEQSWLVHKAMDRSRLVIVPDYGHSSDTLKKFVKCEISKFI